MISMLLFQEINIQTLLFSAALMVGIAVIFGILIVIISKVFEVQKDSRIDDVLAHLPKANCGGCGHPGCEGFAKALVEGTANINDCAQTSAEDKAEIAKVLGIEFAGSEPTKMVVACCGGEQCSDKADYQGYGDCVSQNMLAGGKKACSAGCMGMGTCAEACPSYALKISQSLPEFDQSLCTTCGLCAMACPKKLIHRIPQSAKVYIACSSECRGKDVMSVCKIGCIGCGMCARNCPQGAIQMVNNLPVIDYSKCTNCGTCVAKCPRKCIKTID